MISGIIQSVNTEPFRDMFRHEVIIDNQKYSVYKKTSAFPHSVGESITLEVTNPKARTAKVVTQGQSIQASHVNEAFFAPPPVAAPQPSVTPTSNKDITIIRQTCVKCASEYFANRQSNVEDVVDYAKRLESYVLNGF